MQSRTTDVAEINTLLVGIARASEWRERRIYINVRGNGGNYRGERTAKLYIELDTGELVHQPGAGMTSDEYDANVERVLKELGQ